MGLNPNEYGAWRYKKGKKNGGKKWKREGGTAEKSDFPMGSGTQIGGYNPNSTIISQPNPTSFASEWQSETFLTSSAPYCYE